MTLHAIERTKERTGLNERAAIKLMNNALDFGHEVDEYHAKERTFLQQKCTDTTRAVVYNGYCFIVADGNRCITMYRLPPWFGKKYQYDGKKAIRNPKKYQKYYCVEYA